MPVLFKINLPSEVISTVKSSELETKIFTPFKKFGVAVAFIVVKRKREV